VVRDLERLRVGQQPARADQRQGGGDGRQPPPLCQNGQHAEQAQQQRAEFGDPGAREQQGLVLRQPQPLQRLGQVLQGPGVHHCPVQVAAVGRRIARHVLVARRGLPVAHQHQPGVAVGVGQPGGQQIRHLAPQAEGNRQQKDG